MPFENGVNWRPDAPGERGRHGSFSSAVDAALSSMRSEKNDFFDSLSDRWRRLFPNLPVRPGRYEDGKIFLYVPSAPANFMVRAHLPAMKRALAALPGAPGRIELRLEIRA